MPDATMPIRVDAATALLGLTPPVPLTRPAMARSLQVMFAPGTRVTPRLQVFGAKLRAAFNALGVRECPVAEALTAGERLDARIVPILLGEPALDLLALGRLPVQSLQINQVVGVFDRPCPLSAHSDPQTRLATLAHIMAAHLTTLCIFVTDATWVVCTMNGAVLTYANGASLVEDIGHDLVPKLAARIVPPRADEVAWHYESFDPHDPACAAALADFRACTGVWARSGLISAHAAPLDLPFRSPLHKMLVLSYLDHRTGMSYGFLARQLPVACAPAMPLDCAPPAFARRVREAAPLCEHDGWHYVQIRLRERDYAVPVPEVAILCTRSGCDKARLVPEADLVRMSLAHGRVTIETPCGIARPDEFRPSYDTSTIFAAALGNCFVASLLGALRRAAPFATALRQNGLALSHWHAELPAERTPPGYVRHGSDNPAVPCATAQGALYALLGKLNAVAASLDAAGTYRGDVQIEPQHGTMLCGVLSLEKSAHWVCRNRRPAA
ncbi:MAG: hypothetical protein NTV22_13140 [bacterium]|nr:hypothetical protein [bacterium]